MALSSIGGVAGASILDGFESLAATIQEQTICTNESCKSPLQPDFKFCDKCGTPTEFGKYFNFVESAKKAEQQNAFDDAANQYVQAAQRRVNDKRKSVALLGAGRSYLQLKKFDEAGRELEKAKKLDPLNGDIFISLAHLALDGENNAAKAESACNEADRLSKKPELTAEMRGDIAFSRKAYADALKAYTTAESVDPNSAKLNYRIGLCLIAANGEFSQVDARLRKAMSLAPKWPDPVLALAMLDDELGKYAESTKLWKQVCALAPTFDDAHARYAQSATKAELWDEAMAAYDGMLKRDPKSYDALVGLGGLAIDRQRDLPKALQLFERALDVRPGALAATLGVSRCHDLNGDPSATAGVSGASTDRAPSYSPDGASLAFQSDRAKSSHIFVLRPSGQSIQISKDGSCGDPTFSPDGKYLAYHSDRKNVDLYLYNLETNAESRLTSTNGNDESPSFSPDGKQIVFQSKRDKNWEIYVMPTEGGEAKRLTNVQADDVAPKFSPDGKHILFQSARSGPPKLWIMDANGQNPRKVTSANVEEGFACWSPDGKRIAYSIHEKSVWNLYVMNADGSGSRRLTNSKEDEIEVTWHPNGVRLTYTVIHETKGTSGGGGYGGGTGTPGSRNFDIVSVVLKS